MTEERATNLCSKCGNPIMPANLPYSYVGQVCLCFHKLGEVPEQPSPSLTEHDVRRIVRDELVRSRVIADRGGDVAQDVDLAGELRKARDVPRDLMHKQFDAPLRKRK